MASTSNPTALSFDNTEVAFAGKSNRELRKAYWLFRVMNSHTVVDVGTHLTRIAFQIGLPVKTLVKRTIYQQFCGGETLPETAPLVERLAQNRVSTILDYGVEAKESEAEFDQNVEEQRRAIAFANGNRQVPYVSCKVTGYASFDLLEKMHARQPLSSGEEAAVARLRQRLDQIGAAAAQSDVALYIDAEESWIQDPIDTLTEELMSRYNREKPVIFNTAQLYRHDRLAYLQQAHERAEQGGYVFAVKLVRGAYMEKERERARQLGYPSPIQPDKAATDRDYDQALQFCLEHFPRIAFCVATHNETSCMLAAQGALDRGADPHHPALHFAQLYGMSDHISFNLAKAGFNASKYVPYGPVRDVIPYLIRRAEENSSVAGQMGRELGLIRTEMKRRGLK
ncbi:MAG: proline dehydrogenase [Bacteroidetes bacterium]|nr:proline dehydrogenase [Bacteroidota bacterium]